ncbi:MAG: hypothetical protein HPY50_05520 [Firmicutes bacterium]|nr:hypothetical protein [Bacillota bacterium]
MKRFITVLMILCIWFLGDAEAALAVNASFTVGSRDYYVDGRGMTMDVSPYIRNGRTFMPLRYVAYSLGVAEEDIYWDNRARTVTLLKDDRVVQVKIGNTVMLVNGIAVNMDVVPEIRDGRVMLPLRFLAQAFGVVVSWDAAARTASLSTGGGSSVYTTLPGATSTGEMVINYRWVYQGRKYNWDLSLDKATIVGALDYYREKPHPMFDPLNRYDFVDTYTRDRDDDKIISLIVEYLEDMADEEGYDDNETVEFVLAFVQGFPYISDSASSGYDEYPRYPLETFLERCGDCEDTSILAGVLLREMGYGAALLFLPGHCSLGVYGEDNVAGSYYEYEGKRYFYTEMTDPGWRIGQVPKSEKGTRAMVAPLL